MSLRRLFISGILLLVGAASIVTATAGGKGSLFIIGGGKRPASMMQEFIRLAGGMDRARIVVVPNASSEPETSGIEQAARFRELGAQDVRMVYLSRAEAEKEVSASRFDGATGIFFTGGDQSLLTRDLLGTPALEAIRRRHAQGAVVGGTSAGAAVMSEVMITGDEALNKDTVNAFVFVRRGNVVTKEGFGFLTSCIVDQHFLKRKRHNRLISVVLEHPKLLGLAIDEVTAAVVGPDAKLRVVGEGSVLLLDASHASTVRTDDRGNLGASGLRMHLLLDGDRFDLTTRRPIR